MKEQEIRPQALLERYVELSAQDAKNCFADVERRELACVACGSEKSTAEFEKNGFGYARCGQCNTLYQTPRPILDAFEKFYRNSESSRYWAEVFFPAVAEIRREKIFRPRTKRLIELCKSHELDVNQLIDVGAGYGIFLDEWRKYFPDVNAIAVEPSESLAFECREKGLKVIESIAENVKGYDNFADLTVCFEVLEHVDAPLSFVNTLKSMTKSGGYVFISTLCIDGFDLQILGEQSTQISPPHHINFLSIQGFKTLFKRAGLVDIEVFTPGVLDVDIIRNAAKKDLSLLENHPFLRVILGDEQKSKAFQAFLSDNQLSSHVWVLGKKA